VAALLAAMEHTFCAEMNVLKLGSVSVRISGGEA
jgi:hypothetical protein